MFCIQNASSTLLGRVYTFRRKSSTNQSQAVIDEAVEALEGLHVDKHLLKGPVWDNVKIHAARVSHKLQVRLHSRIVLSVFLLISTMFFNFRRWIAYLAILETPTPGLFRSNNLSWTVGDIEVSK
ncbi:hypothetical protein EON65_50560 [archaeon]|nr:MAG: hypothetical protein EON65_50560 [archaeon]